MFSSSMLRDFLEPLVYRYGLFDDPYEEYYLNPSHVHLSAIRPRRQISVRSSRQSESMPDSMFQVMLNVKHFRPDEIYVKTVDNFVAIHCKHEEQADEHGFVSREFTRRYKLPEDVEPEKVTSSLSKDGVLTIEAPKKMIEPPPKNERIVPITIQQHSAVEEVQKMQQQQKQQQQEAAGEQQTADEQEAAGDKK